MRVSDYIVAVLKDIGVEYVFGYQGANISFVIDSLSNDDKIVFVETYNEQGGAFAADGYASTSGKLGVAIASSGPGAINILSGIANAYFDSIPCLFITGNVGFSGIRGDQSIRQKSFQELDIVSMTKGITKYSVLVKNADELPAILSQAITLAFDGRPGAVHIDIPHNIQKSDIDVDVLNIKPPLRKQVDIQDIDDFIQSYLSSIASAQRPLILIGGGAANSLTKVQIASFIEKLNIPVVASLNGLTGVDAYSKNVVGFIGDYGNRYANYAIHYCDNLLILGSRLDDRQIGGDSSKFAPNAKIFRVDIDDIEIKRKVHSAYLIGDIKAFFHKFMSVDIHKQHFDEWVSEINQWKRAFPSYYENTKKVHVNTYFHYLSSRLDCEYIVCADVGQNQMAVAQSFLVGERGRLLNSGGLGAMGYALPAAIGAKYACRTSTVISINGDGGLQMNLQEMKVIQRDNLDIKIIVISNNCLGMIRQYQTFALSSKFHGSLLGYENPDFMKIADTYDLAYMKVDDVSKYEESLALIKGSRACLIEVCIDYDIHLMPEMGIHIMKQNYDRREAYDNEDV